MLLNAVEASSPGDEVRIGALKAGDQIKFSVWNQTAIPPNVQLRIFQRHFTTKAGSGHGLGTFSVRLFGERYMGGHVTFVSDARDGTTFTLSLPMTPAE